MIVSIRDFTGFCAREFLGYRVENYKLFVFVAFGVHGASPVRFTCRRSASSIQASSPRGVPSEAVIWVAVGGRGALSGAVIGALVVNYAKTVFTSGFLARY